MANLEISIIGPDGEVKSTFKSKPGPAAGVLAMLAAEWGTGVLKDSAAVRIPASEDRLLPDEGPFQFVLTQAGGGQQGAGDAGAVAVGRVRTVLCIKGRKQALEYSMLAPDNIIDLTQLEKACNIKIEACDFAAPADAHQAPLYKPNFKPCTNLTPTITPGQAVWVKASADNGRN